MRVVCLAPAAVVLGLLFRTRAQRTDRGFALPVPLFVIGFLAMILIRSVGLAPSAAVDVLTGASQGLLLVSVVALGVQTSLKDLLAPGLAPILALVLQTALIGVIALVGALMLF
jgi:uncharacterized membrane protein YadS